MNISFVNDVFIYCSGKVDVTGFPVLILLIFEGKGGGEVNITIFYTNLLFHFTSKMFLEH